MDAVNQHEPGRLDESAIAVGSWRRDELAALLGDAKGLLLLMSMSSARGVPRGLSGWTFKENEQLWQLATREAKDGTTNRLRRRGAMLHADVALLVPPPSDPIPDTSASPNPRNRSSEPARSTILFADGRHQGTRYAGLHWDVARTLLDGLTPDPSHGEPDPLHDEMVNLWYRATSAWMLRHHQFTDAIPHLQRAREIFPMNVALARGSGGMYEMLASPRVQGFIRTTALPSGVTVDVPSERENLRRAEAFYRQALALDPELAETRVKLGRVLGLQGRHEEAVRELQRASASTTNPLIRYDASLFLGADEEALGHADRARDAYETASTLFPLAQSPYLALSQLAWRGGDRAGALRAIQPVMTFPGGAEDRRDPWWEYYEGTGRDAESLLDLLHALFQIGGRQ